MQSSSVIACDTGVATCDVNGALTCNAGYRLVAGSPNTCAACGVGSWSAGGTATSCTTCTGYSGWVATCSATTGGALTCQAGYVLTGTAGASGTFCAHFVVGTLKVFWGGCWNTYANAAALCSSWGMRLPNRSEVSGVAHAGAGKYSCACDAWYQGGDSCGWNCNYCTIYTDYYDYIYGNEGNIGTYCVRY